MPASNPSPPGPASATAAGLVNLAVQTFAGVKTFAATLIASAGVQLGLLFNTNGSGSSDVVVKAGTSLADASVNAAAKLLSVRTGLNGGTEVESVYIKKGAIVGGGGGDCLRFSTTSVELLTTYMARLSAPFILYAAGTSAITETVRLIGARGDANLKCVTLGTEQASPNADCVLTQFAVAITTASSDAGNGTARARLMASGRLDQRGVVSATVGAETQNNPKGVNTLASGATSVTITNSLVTASSWVDVTFHADPGGRYWVTRAAGSFTVNVSAAPGANAPFSWEVATLLP